MNVKIENVENVDSVDFVDKALICEENDSPYPPLSTLSTVSMDLFKARFNQAMANEIKSHLFRFKNENKLSVFDEIIAHGGILCKKIKDDEYQFKIPLD